MENLDDLADKNKINEDADFKEHQKQIEEVRNSFHYYVGGVEITKEHFNAIKKRGYVIPEETDKDRSIT